MLETVLGPTSNQPAARALIAELRRLDWPDSTLYVGYPILSTADGSLVVDALLIAPHCGLVILDLLDPAGAPADARAWAAQQERQEHLVLAAKSRLLAYPALSRQRDLAVPVEVVAVATGLAPAAARDGLLVATPSTLGEVLGALPPMDRTLLRPLNAVLQRVSTIKPAKRRAAVRHERSRGGSIRAIEREIANLDRWQNRAAIETPEGPQRIRGLAGSGKTVVLALKASYLHALHPDWTIAVTFQTRSLYQQFTDLLRRFTYELARDEPDWERLRALHAWGGASSPGVYSEIARHCGVPALDFSAARRRFGTADAFDGACAELLREVDPSALRPLFDAILIDEAQDLPQSFLRLAYAAAAAPKRVIWGIHLGGVGCPRGM